MAIKVKDAAASMQKYITNTGNAVNAYKAGIQSPKASQSASAVAAVTTWQQAVQSPAAAKAFTSGLTKAGDAAWQAGALNKGAARYPQGTQIAAPKWQTNVQPYLQTIASQNLPPRGIRGAAQNWQRSQNLGQALHAQKVAAKGGS